eukprot:TRINITY_DN358_c0_g1_i1.p1 TRINITY_DN358_c0_g1~~TRINITY_DN358_c0_g1_i1.p1  ORF type:complete len:192 (-),score=5.31 TRINITY_DN358_c0_g1_i1:120-695(-)
MYTSSIQDLATSFFLETHMHEDPIRFGLDHLPFLECEQTELLASQPVLTELETVYQDSEMFSHSQNNIRNTFPNPLPSPVTRTTTIDTKKRFICNDCGHGFSRNYDLKTHYRIHTKERPYVCSFPDCQKNFARSSGVREHERNVHFMAPKRDRKRKSSIPETQGKCMKTLRFLQWPKEETSGSNGSFQMCS